MQNNGLSYHVEKPATFKTIIQKENGNTLKMTTATTTTTTKQFLFKSSSVFICFPPPMSIYLLLKHYQLCFIFDHCRSGADFETMTIKKLNYMKEILRFLLSLQFTTLSQVISLNEKAEKV